MSTTANAGWGRFTAAVCAGSTAVGGVAMITSGPWKVGATAAVTTLAGFLVERSRPRRRTRATSIPLTARLPQERAIAVREITDPCHVGVHPSAPVGDPRDPGHRVPPFVPRDAESTLETALATARFVLVVGESAAGKTRLAFRTAQRLYPDHTLLCPRDRPSAVAALDRFAVAAEPREAATPVLLFLDDLEIYLGAGGLQPAAVARALELAPSGSRLLATMRTEERRRYLAHEESRLTGDDHAAWRAERAVLQLALEVPLSRRWSAAECERAADFVGDVRIRAALLLKDSFGLAEVMASGPELVDAWNNAWVPHGNPRGAAIVAAAVDARRIGLRRPIPGDWLEELHTPYLEARGGTRLLPESFDAALAWACRPAYATSGLLIHDHRVGESCGYRAFDYLLSAPGLPPVPDHLWERLLPKLSPEDAYDLGIAAQQQGELQRALNALEQAAEAGVEGAVFALAIVTGDSGHPRRAVELLRTLHPARSPRKELAVRTQLAFFLGESGALGDAVERFRLIVEETREALGDNAPEALAAWHQLAFFLCESGGVEEGVQELTRLLAVRERLAGPYDRWTVATRRGLLWYSALHGDKVAAEQAMRRLLVQAQERIGLRDAQVLAIRSSLAAFDADAGRFDEAAAAFASLARDRAEVLGADHPHVLQARLQWTGCLLALRDPRAREQITAVFADASRVLEPGHRHLVTARTQLARFAPRS